MKHYNSQLTVPTKGQLYSWNLQINHITSQTNLCQRGPELATNSDGNKTKELWLLMAKAFHRG